ncbi:uncharacterized protein LOC119771109 [Culex quinquefasciatus]|uniref:uncharacterized protein LOC119771109 n=1 Tax=Culex quinquefasciatus TaxID=7176 RepID=UPI0018E33B09|nr:uncharacterized protein LOC119771109 [Culex quinquefasciatus]
MSDGEFSDDDRESMHSADDTGFIGFPEEKLAVPVRSAIVRNPNQQVQQQVPRELQGLFRLREQMRQRIVGVRRNLQKQKQLAVGPLKVMKEMLAAAFKEYNGCHNEVMTWITDDELPAQVAIYQEFEDMYFEVSTTVEELYLEVKNRDATPSNTKPQVVVQQRPLKVPIPSFDGSYANWPKFKAIFLDLMANSGDSDVVKLYHLEKALVGEAEGSIDAKVLNEGNYKQAWADLAERFDNLRVIVESHLRALLSLKRMTSESHNELRSLINEVTRNVESLRYLKQELTGVSEHMLVFLITNALDQSTRKAWEATQKKGELPKYAPTMEFLKSRAHILENCEVAFEYQSPPATKPKPTFKPAQRSHAVAAIPASESTCDFCGGSHGNYQCSTLTSLSMPQRREKVRVAGLCYNCLRKGHFVSGCPSTKACRKCEARHNTLLHDDAASIPGRAVQPKPLVVAEATALQPAVEEAPSSEVRHVSASCSSLFPTRSKTVLLLTAVVDALDKHGKPQPCRVLLDSGSQVNFVTEELANRLGVKKQPANVPITGINELRTHARDKVLVKFRSRVSSFACALECLVTPKVTGKIPSRKIDVSGWRLPEGVVLADQDFHTPDKVDMLIGGELFFDILKPRHLRLSDNLPQLRETHLGWVVAGVLKEPYVADVPIQHSNMATLEEVETMMKQFWQVEDLPDVPKLSREEAACESHFLSTYRRDPTGRFVVQQPFKKNVVNLDDCRDLALKRFLMLEKRLMRNPELQTQYIQFIREYEALGHCHEVIEADDPQGQKNFYLPHHAVLRPSSSSTKCRVVFDASARTSPNNLALNDVLLVGPVVQSELYAIMLRFRIHKIAFTADISKMYRQILMAPEHRHYQRIFWREQTTQPLRVLELDTVTYGTASAPYQATRCLAQLAEEEKDEFPIAARIVQQEVYMDDMLSGAETVSEAIEAQQQLKQLLGHGGFPVHKWCSNSVEFLKHVPVEERETQVPLEESGANKVIKVLGLLWDPEADTLLIANQTRPSTSDVVTKRRIYAEVAKFYDPLGLFSPAIVLAKLQSQHLWKIKADWDDPLEGEVARHWQDLQVSLAKLNQIQVPRRVTANNAVAYELHGFADASNVAYGACVYLRSIFADGSAKMSLLTSKSKLAPLKELSIPRKECCGALLLTRLVKKVITELNMEFQDVVLWCDSMIVLAWIKKPLNQLKQFVRNRIAVIQDETEGFRWEYINTENNPADIVSRGQGPELLRDNRLWWYGPDFLAYENYQTVPPQAVPDDDLPEMNAVFAAPTVSIEPFPLFSRCSSFRKIQRIVGYALRFAENCRKKPAERRSGQILTIIELRKSREAILKVIQLVHLGDEIRRVRLNEPCKRIGNLRPILHEGLLRVGGRLDRSQLAFECRHPIILPDKDPLVRKMIEEMHIDFVHVGQNGLVNALRQRFWLLNARSTIRKITRRCVKCFRCDPTRTTQLMGNLPPARVVPSPPFAATGVDYAGPFWVKQGSRRPTLVKAYLAVFVCMATKAVHLELVSDLSTDAFVAALRRMISRRGCVQELHSNNATNFKGAHHELHELHKQFRDQLAVQRIVQFCQEREIEWHFIPPDAPEFGGLWEAAVKSAKTHLKRIVGNAKLTYEEFSTVLTEIEAVLNSRPMFAVSNDPADPLVITPAHYLIGRPLTAPAEPSLEDLNANRLDRWQHLQLMREHFWRAWSREYLNTLQPRKKNLRAMPNVRVGMIVLLHDRVLPPLNWKLGRITAVYPGEDGFVRAVDVTVNGSTYRRPINKISILPIEDNQPDEASKVEQTQPGGGCSVSPLPHDDAHAD